MQKRKALLEEKIEQLERQIGALPEGKLICTHTGPYAKWFCSDGHTKIYINKSRRPLAEKLAIKKYLQLQKEDLLHEKIAVEQYLNVANRYTPKAEELLCGNTEFEKLLSPYFRPLSKELEEWMQEEYPKNMMHPEHLIHKIGQNQRVRSKSEAMIGKALQNNRMPFRYECALELAGNIYYPDFTIRHPRTGSVVYWEHFGMMDDPGYMRHMLAKLEIYLLNQIIPGVNLIITFETRDNPLTFETIDEQIKFYLL